MLKTKREAESTSCSNKLGVKLSSSPDISPMDGVKTNGGMEECAECVNIDTGAAIEIETKFRTEFYSLCHLDTRTSSSREGSDCGTPHSKRRSLKGHQRVTASLPDLPSSGPLLHNFTQEEENDEEFDEITQQIADLSRTVEDLNKSLSSLNGLDTECETKKTPVKAKEKELAKSDQSEHWIDDGYPNMLPVVSNHFSPSHKRSPPRSIKNKPAKKDAVLSSSRTGRPVNGGVVKVAPSSGRARHQRETPTDIILKDPQVCHQMDHGIFHAPKIKCFKC